MMMKKLLLALTLSLAALPIYADEMSPTKGGYDLPPPRTSKPKPPAAPVEAAPAIEAAPAVVTPPQPSPVVEMPPPRAATPEPVVMPAAAVPAARAARADDTGWFAGVGLGYSKNQDYDCNACGDPRTSLDDSGFAYKIFGGYRLHRNFALSVGYLDLADTKAASVGGSGEWNDRLKVDGFYAAAHGILPVTDKIDVFATLGALHWNQKVAFSSVPFTDSGSFNGTDLMYGLGASYALNKPGAKLQLEWNRLTDVGTNDPDLGHTDDYDLFTVNLVYQF